ncbi:MAG TPA: hypothetical protein VMK13_13050 [Streptosporangiaceae bacterium]|nr:hypothetical protein [Streptosporangiaceae bacterium]
MTATTADGGLAAALIQLADHAGQLRDLRNLVASLADTIRGLHDQLNAQPAAGAGYRPIPAPRWWQLAGEDRAGAVRRLSDWVEQVYRPCYGHLAARLAPCWREHPFCLFTLDWLAELWSVLYLQPKRTPPMLTGQAEWQHRLLPAAAEAMALETRDCGHPRRRP